MSLDQLAIAPRDRASRPDRNRRDVVLLRWPAQEAQRQQLTEAGVPRLLLVSHSSPAPECHDELEDWAREPLDPVELDVRTATLQQRARQRALRPRVDESGLVWVGHSFLDFPSSQLAVARLLVDGFGGVVAAERIQATYRTAGGSVHPKAVKAMIGRVKRRFAALDLVLTNVRDRGYLLEAATRSAVPHLVQLDVQE